MEKSKYQKFVIETIGRNQILNAPYNPRYIKEENKKKLKKFIEEDGLLAPITWNKRTGNIVSGHRRIEALDVLEGNNNYNIDVAVIDVDTKTEKRLNILLNNSNLQGSFDIGLLKDFKVEDNFDFEKDLLFDRIEIEYLFEGTEYADLFNEDQPEIVDQLSKYTKDKNGKDALDKIKEQRKKYREKINEDNNPSYIMIVVFQNNNHLLEFQKKHKIKENERYISAQLLEEIISPNIKQ